MVFWFYLLSNKLQIESPILKSHLCLLVIYEGYFTIASAVDGFVGYDEDAGCCPNNMHVLHKVFLMLSLLYSLFPFFKYYI